MSKAARREARERLKQQRIAEERKRKRNTYLVIGAAVLVLVLVVAGGYLWFSSDRGDEGPEALAPQTLQEDGSVVMATDGGGEKPLVEVYADFQCPACKQLEVASGPAIKELAASGQATVQYRPVSIFALQQDPISTNSLRAAGAARAAADHGRFVEFHDLVFENQPTEGQPGFATEDLVDWGKEAGIDDPAFAERVESEAAVAEEFGTSFGPDLLERAQGEIGAEQINTMPITDLIAWGEENGLDASFLDGSYVQEVLEATAAVNERYSGADAFSGTPAVYLNGSQLGDEAFSASGLRGAVEGAGPGEVETQPLEGEDAGSSDASPSASPDAKE
ncbi:DsbA family protein [Nocardiopsis coralliicola]